MGDGEEIAGGVRVEAGRVEAVVQLLAVRRLEVAHRDAQHAALVLRFGRLLIARCSSRGQSAATRRV